MKKQSFILVIAFLTIGFSNAQSIQWQKSLGGSFEEHMDGDKLIKQTPDGGYAVAGTSGSGNGDVTFNHGPHDFWFVKLNANGGIQWQKTYGSTTIEICNGMSLTSDGGYILAGYSVGNDGDVTGNHGQEDYWVVKIDSVGTLQWQKSLGGSDNDKAWGVGQSSDGSYYVTGGSESNDGDVTGNHGQDCWIVKLSSSGNLLWQKAIGGSGFDEMFSLVTTSDGGCVVGGYTTSTDGDVVGNHGQSDLWMVKMDSTGIIQWQKCYGGSSGEQPNGFIIISVTQTADNGFILAGETGSTDGDVTGTMGHIWLVKTDSVGTMQWQKRLGGTSDDEVNSITQTSDGGYVIVGYTWSTDGDITVANYSLNDYFVMKVNNVGTPQWQTHLGGSGDEFPSSIIQTTDGGYLVGGISWSNDFDVTGNHGFGDYWIVKLSATVGMEEDIIENGIGVYPNPFTEQTTINFTDASTSSATHHTIKIMDVIGREIKTINFSGKQCVIEKGEMNAGVYFIRIVSTGSTTDGSPTNVVNRKVIVN